MTKTKAIKLARKEVSDLYKFGNSWKYSVYDESVNAWRDNWPCDYYSAKIYRSFMLIDKAKSKMGCGDMEIFQSQNDFEDFGGKWVDYV